MDEMIKVKFENVSKVFPIHRSKKDKIFSILSFWKQDNVDKYYYALNDISFEVKAGESVGLVGLNGAGKSTLSNLLGGVTEPTSGKILINGKSSLIAISAGLNNELSGEENIKMKCLMHGLTEKQINERYDSIVNFSELGKFISQPIKSYSSGMRSRLGFAIAVHTDPDVLIVDEALSVGDDTFSNKCILKMKEFQAQGTTIFFVSHSVKQIQSMCDKAIWLHYGEMKEFGDCIPVVGLYARFVRQYNEMSKDKQLEYKEEMADKQMKNMIIREKDNQFPLSSIGILCLLTLLLTLSILSQLNIIPLSHFLNLIKESL